MRDFEQDLPINAKNMDADNTRLPLNLSKIGPPTVDPIKYPMLLEVVKNAIWLNDLKKK